MYGGEIGEFGDGVIKELNKKQLDFGNWVLGVRGGVVNNVVLWELGWLPMEERILIMRERFLTRLEGLDEQRLAKRVMLGRSNQGWVKKTKAVIEKFLGNRNRVGFKKQVVEKIFKMLPS